MYALRIATLAWVMMPLCSRADGTSMELPMADQPEVMSIYIRDVRLQSSSGSALAFGSEMSGGISDILAEHLHLHDSCIGIEVKTSRGRGGYVKDILISDVEMVNVHLAIEATGKCESHPDDKFDPYALPVVKGITFKDIVGTNITTAGKFLGIYESPFTSICLSNISFSNAFDPSTSWVCSNVSGFSETVSRTMS